jgi:hypothetical protein
MGPRSAASFRAGAALNTASPISRRHRQGMNIADASSSVLVEIRLFFHQNLFAGWGPTVSPKSICFVHLFPLGLAVYVV